MKRYDVIVIGSGTGGQTASYRLRRAGLNVALVDDSEQPGGTCALTGCQPKKWFYEVAEVIAKSRHLTSGGITVPAAGDWQSVWFQKQKFVEKVPENTIEGLHKAGVDFIKGTAAFENKNTLNINGGFFSADFFILATGARPSSLPFSGAEHLTTSDGFLALSRLPAKIVFVGGGFISFEFAHFAARIGPEERKVLILEAADRPLGMFDEELVDLLVKASIEDGIDVMSNTKITSVDRQGDLFHMRTDSDKVFEADLVVHGASRTPRIDGLNLDKIGVHASKRGIDVNPQMQTSVPHIFAAGDCAATIALARVADFEAKTAAENILALQKNTGTVSVDYRAVPAILFSYPQFGMVGETEASLKKRKIPYRKNRATGLQWSTYRRVGMKYAGYKILVAEDDTILGAHILSDNASGLINTFRQAIIDGKTADDLYQHSIMTPYPSRESDIIYMLEDLRRR